MNSAQAKQIPLADVLTRLGHQPHHQRGPQIWYLSPFREETVPSFHIHVERNIWYDFGEGKGGNVLDFMMRYRQVITIGEALKELDKLIGGAPLPLFTPKPAQKPAESEAPPPVGKVKQLHNRALLTYLSSRGISGEIARPYVQEMYYEREGKNYFALAFKNDAGGYELRNPYFKGTHGAKDVTLIPSEQRILEGRRVAVFEGFLDFLSAIAAGFLTEPLPAVLVMNSNAMRERAIGAIQKSNAQGVDLYLDHDKSGRELVDYFRKEIVGLDVVDCSGLYIGHKDVNAYLTAGRHQAVER